MKTKFLPLLLLTVLLQVSMFLVQSYYKKVKCGKI